LIGTVRYDVDKDFDIEIVALKNFDMEVIYKA
jgi:hypothetical protein